MNKLFSEEKITYTGKQLRSRFAFTKFGITGDSIISFRGPCDIKPEAMVDLQDLKNNERIYSEDMLHFIIEHNEKDLIKSVLRQFIFSSVVNEILNHYPSARQVSRRKTDLYDDDAKLSISIATVTPISSVIHFGINVSSLNTPVKTRGLKDYGIKVEVFAHQVMDKYIQENNAVITASNKVKWVH